MQGVRDGDSPGDLTPPTSIISNDRLDPISYKIKSSDNNCSSFFVTPKASTEKILFEFGFKISSSGNIPRRFVAIFPGRFGTPNLRILGILRF